MKRSRRLFITGSVHSLFFEQFVQSNAEKIGIRGFMRKLDDGRMEVFIEGDGEKVDEMTQICKRGSQHTQIRNVEEKEDRLQGFSNFKVLKI
ncbi:MAG: acylphosphatase [Nanoarchaeota archaeon]|nr:acylphosphatase [Nanoarchaeota archaeon]